MPTPNENQPRGQFRFTVPLADIKMDASGDPESKGRWTMRGHAAVFNRLSHDMGGFRAKIHPGFFDKILDSNPDVHLNREHDMRLLLARTRNNSLELRADPYGLHTWARFVKTPLAEETAILMQEGVLDQMSFACDIGAQEWTDDTEGNITWNLHECVGLFDVTICAQGAFPQTDSQLVASISNAGDLLASAQEAGLVTRREQNPDLVAARGETRDGIALQEGAAAVAEDYQARLAALQQTVEVRYSAARDPQV